MSVEAWEKVVAAIVRVQLTPVATPAASQAAGRAARQAAWQAAGRAAWLAVDQAALEAAWQAAGQAAGHKVYWQHLLAWAQENLNKERQNEEAHGSGESTGK